MSLGAPELVVILLILLLVFGGAKLPKLARSLGQAQGEFKKGIDEGDATTAASSGSGSTPPATDAPITKAADGDPAS